MGNGMIKDRAIKTQKVCNDKGEVAVVCNDVGWFLEKELRDEYGERMLFDPVLVKMVIERDAPDIELRILRNKLYPIENYSLDEHQYNNQCIQALENNSREASKKIKEYITKEYPLFDPEESYRFYVDWVTKGKKFTLIVNEETGYINLYTYEELLWAVA
jgi:hypothetical protein